MSWASRRGAALPDRLIHVEEFHDGDAHVIAVRGEIDISTAPMVSATLEAVLDGRGCGLVAIDLAGVSFMGSAGLHALLGARCLVEDSGGRLVVVCADHHPAYRVISLAGLTDAFSIWPSRASRLAAFGDGS